MTTPPGSWPEPPGPSQWGPAPGMAPHAYQAYPGWGSPQYRLAGFWKRVGAAVLDGLIVAVPGYVLLFVVIGATGLSSLETCEDEFGNVEFCNNGDSAGLVIGVILVWVLMLIGPIVYTALLDGKRGQTLGRKAVGIRLVNVNTIQPIGAWPAVGRHLAKILSGIPCYLGFFWMLWDDRKQTWHDKMVSSIVIDDGAAVPFNGYPGAQPQPWAQPQSWAQPQTWAQQPGWAPPPAGGPNIPPPPPPPPRR